MNAAWIKTTAQELGFHLVGIASAERPPEADFLQEWLRKGFAGEMTYLSRNVEKREHPRLLFPPARSIIVCGLSYHSRTDETERISPQPIGQISRYARGADYHHVLKEKLFALLHLMQADTPRPIVAKVCVDTAPLLERACAKSAGLGWIGKHGGVINPRYGSWCFLGEILVDFECEYDTPMKDGCGACTRCLDACPTGALIAPYTLDARKCLSYLTIEHRGVIPETLRPALGNCVFGCDRCQEVCPYNQQADAPGLAEFLPRESLKHLSLEWLATLSEHDFPHIFADSPILRTGWRGLLRNTAVAIGNSHDRDLLPVLRQLSRSPESLIREHAEWGMTRLLS
ncbi:hypothetical protein U14_02046 [Candidatus Moduliflexus flocculans]|uniref:4Fe-4S ferredoxin-type domain-containing protein n=1 Tax=Candidatus Moduliflexus flocculans TaxID=1499966 RepID=A0A0S6VTF5_9BACT|nr:hypothetical protein U14_02046 [Candidatus Moduliflexus flocculans]